MKKLLFRFLIIAVLSICIFLTTVFLVTYLGLNRWIPNARNTAGRGYYTYSRLAELKKEKKVDVLFVGSSHVYRGIDTRLFEKKGINVFNLGTSGQTPMNTYYLLKEHLNHLNPSTVVLDLYLEGLGNDGSSAAIEIASNHEISENIFEMATRNLDVQTISSLAAIELSRIHTPLSEVKELKLKDDKYITGGYIESKFLSNKLSIEQLAKLPKSKLNFNNLQREYLFKIINLCKKKNIKLVMIILPFTEEFRLNITNYNKILNELQKLASEHNIVFFDYNTDLSLSLNSINDFLDANHLNPNGAKKVTSAILKGLEL